MQKRTEAEIDCGDRGRNQYNGFSLGRVGHEIIYICRCYRSEDLKCLALKFQPWSTLECGFPLQKKSQDRDLGAGSLVGR